MRVCGLLARAVPFIKCLVLPSVRASLWYGAAVDQDRPSRTAGFVAFLRAVAARDLTGVRGFSDPTAATLLPQPFARLYETVAWLDERGFHDVLRRGLSGPLDVMPLRTLAIDEQVRAGLGRGATQLVILGAGLDGRAYRMPELGSAVVFEVDHPASQADKRARARSLGAPVGELYHVAVDFERDALEACLEQAGHEASRPTVWIWEGVITYLTLPALRGTLAAVARRSAPKSRLCAQYREPTAAGDVAGESMLWVMRKVREPHIGLHRRERMREEIEAAGLVVLEDTGADDWAARFDDAARLPRLARYTRLTVAERA
jgi:methyltransferase (TIGR00027 family)